MANRGPSSSKWKRFARLGGLVGRVGTSMVAGRIRGLGDADAAREYQRQALIGHAEEIARTLGEMKGAAMKVGQMLSLHDGLLPDEVNEALRELQNNAPRVPAEVMEFEVRGALPEFDEIFESFETEAFAAASIGQVHRGRLRDGREVAVKVQYPLIDEIVRADLGNLRPLMQSVFALVSEVDFKPVWHELRDRLHEELDYRQEADNGRKAAELYADVPGIVIPAIVDEATTANVLTMEFTPGRHADEALTGDVDPELRNEWGRNLFDFVFSGLLGHHFLHADPNLANFGFRDDGSIVVYDFGCIKRVPPTLARGYVRLFRAAASRDHAAVPDALRSMTIARVDGRPLPEELVRPYVDLFGDLLRRDRPYTFGEDPTLYDRLIELGMANWQQAADVRFPSHIIFIDRTLAGLFGNLIRLGASGNWGERLEAFVGPTGG